MNYILSAIIRIGIYFIAVLVTIILVPVTLLGWLLRGIFTKKTDPEVEENRDRATLYSPGKAR